ncbi:Protein STABILIZED1 [Striga hermonthica]|uniref:Protein STABILIZED1 n=1 Tax=Striga hermonthica TaxID=68872 RepID=A0A9N7NE31_STRHE|nr:Protein STABILIZED1 [Striga hermonthica]
MKITSDAEPLPGWKKWLGKLRAARQLIDRGCEECPKSEDVWLEACRLSVDEAAKKAVIARGVKAIPRSVKLWMQASKLEGDDVDKRSRVLRKALEHVPYSVKLWKAVVELANENDARLLLQRAVECCPFHVELWLALVRLESYENAKKVLNKARSKLPKEPAIWITAAKLEEINSGGSNDRNTEKIIENATKAIQMDRESWMKEVEAVERGSYVATCRAIICCTVGIGVEEEDRKRTWVADAEECEKRGSIETARAIYAHALTVFRTKKSIWVKAARLEKSHGSRDSLDKLLREAVTYVPHAEILWLMGAKEKWLAGDVPSACAILEEAYAKIPNSNEIWLAAFKLEFENHEPERARMIPAKARDRGGKERVWMKSAILERELGNAEEERILLDEGIKHFPWFFKLWLMLGQLGERQGSEQKAKEAYELGIKNCPGCVPLWLSLARLEEKVNGLSKARAVLTIARKKNPQNPQLCLAAVRAENRHGNKKESEILMAKALQECPSSGILWAESIDMAPRKKTYCRDAYTRCGPHDPHVLAAVGKTFWRDGKVEKARSWFNRAVELGPDIGDFWALYYKLELEHGTEATRSEVLSRCVAAEPKHGEKWQSISKAVENSHRPTEFILKKVVIALGEDGSKS